MGGGTFAQAAAPGEPTLNTPRMSPSEYTTVKTIYLSKLQGYLPHAKVACLTEAPEKAHYGDMDLLIAIDERMNFVDLANRIGAVGIVCQSSGRVQKCSLAVRKDGAGSERSVVVYEHVHVNGGRTETFDNITTEEYAQVDIEIVSPELLEWYTFYSSYGDMAGLLGHIVHNLGFTVSDLGLWLRLKVLDLSKTVHSANVAGKDGMILLSSDPSLVMEFLGLSVEAYNAGFQTLNELYEWLGACRLLAVEAIKVKRDNAHELNREKKRTVYSNFLYEWLPAHTAVDANKDEVKASFNLDEYREKYAQEAIAVFAKQKEYNIKHWALVDVVRNASASNLLKPLIAQHSGRSDKALVEILKAFRRYVAFHPNGEPYVCQTPHSDAESQLQFFLGQDAVSLKNPQVTSEWIREHWEELRSLERRRVKIGAGDNR